MIFPRAELWAALAFIVSVAASPLEKRVSVAAFSPLEKRISVATFSPLEKRVSVVAASPLEKRVSSVLIGFRTLSAQQALIYQNAGNTLVWSKGDNSEQIGTGTYMSPILGDWPGDANGWNCAVLADSAAWDLVNKAWVPEADGCTKLWWGSGVPNIPAYLAYIGGPGFTMANTALLSAIPTVQKLQLALPRELHGASGGLSIVTQCVAKSNAAGMAALGAYGYVDWSRWVNVKGTVQTVSP